MQTNFLFTQKTFLVFRLKYHFVFCRFFSLLSNLGFLVVVVVTVAAAAAVVIVAVGLLLDHHHLLLAAEEEAELVNHHLWSRS
jgi:REP element-mobilizing transposase RayT